MTEEYWANSQLSPVRNFGHIKLFGQEYIIVNKEGKDIFQCCAEAMKNERQYAIEPGEPCDLVDKRYVPIYRKIGRDKFIEWVKEGLLLDDMKKRLKGDENGKIKAAADTGSC